jgi:argininosuccinate lyase
MKVAKIVLDDLTLNEEKTYAAATNGYLNATELADHLVKKGVPFRTAHDAVGRIVLLGLEQGKELGELTLEQMRAISEDIDENVFEALSLEQTISSKSALGGTSREQVASALVSARKYLSN